MRHQPLALPLTLLAAASCLLAAPASARSHRYARPPVERVVTLQPFYEYTRFAPGTHEVLEYPHQHLDGIGGRLSIRGFGFLPPNSSLGIFASGVPTEKTLLQRAVFYGGQLDQYLARRPLFGVLDPFLSLGGGAYHRYQSGTRCAAFPGAGLRIPVPQRSELRFEAHEQIIFQNGLDHEPVVEESRFVYQMGVGWTF